MRFCVRGSWQGRDVELMWDGGWVQGPRDLLLEIRLLMMLDAPGAEDAEIDPAGLVRYARHVLDSVDDVVFDPAPVGRTA